QIVTANDPLGWQLSRGVDAAFVLLLPAGASAQEQDSVIRAVQLIAERKIYLGRGGAVRLTRVRFVAGDEFWRPVPEGLQRWWVPQPLAIAETRAQSTGSGRPWGLEDAVLLSIGMVWRDQLGIAGKGTRFYRALADSIRDTVEVLKPRQLVGQTLHRYAHRVHPSNTLTAYTALINLGSLGHSRAPVAIGQSRHLGNGLLTPVDLPTSLLGGGGLP